MPRLSRSPRRTIGWTGSTGGSCDPSPLDLAELAIYSTPHPVDYTASTLVGTTSLPRPNWSLAICSARSRRRFLLHLGVARSAPRRCRSVAYTGKSYRSIVGPDATGGNDDGQVEDQIRSRTSPIDTYHDGRQTEIGRRWQEAPSRSPNVSVDPSPPSLRNMNGGLTLIERLRAAGMMSDASSELSRPRWTAGFRGMLRTLVLYSAGATPDHLDDRVTIVRFHSRQSKEVRRSSPRPWRT